MILGRFYETSVGTAFFIILQHLKTKQHFDNEILKASSSRYEKTFFCRTLKLVNFLPEETKLRNNFNKFQKMTRYLYLFSLLLFFMFVFIVFYSYMLLFLKCMSSLYFCIIRNVNCVMIITAIVKIWIKT